MSIGTLPHRYKLGSRNRLILRCTGSSVGVVHRSAPVVGNPWISQCTGSAPVVCVCVPHTPYTQRTSMTRRACLTIKRHGGPGIATKPPPLPPSTATRARLARQYAAAGRVVGRSHQPLAAAMTPDYVRVALLRARAIQLERKGLSLFATEARRAAAAFDRMPIRPVRPAAVTLFAACPPPATAACNDYGDNKH